MKFNEYGEIVNEHEQCKEVTVNYKPKYDRHHDIFSSVADINIVSKFLVLRQANEVFYIDTNNIDSIIVKGEK